MKAVSVPPIRQKLLQCRGSKMNSQMTISKNAAATVLGYAVLVVALLAFYLCHGMDSLLGASSPYADAIIFCAIAVGAVFAIQLGASIGWTLSIGTWGAFIVLTAFQEPLTRYLTLAAALF